MYLFRLIRRDIVQAAGLAMGQRQMLPFSGEGSTKLHMP